MKSVYKSEEWKKMYPLDRSQILLVAEGLKPATTIGDKTHTYYTMLHCLKELGLTHTEPSFTRKGNYTIDVYKEGKTIEDLTRKLLDPNLNFENLWRAYGEFYGYPDCCITRYSNAVLQRPDEKSIDYVVFEKEKEDLKKEKEGYPDVLDYRAPSMTPCSVYCQNSLKLLSSWKEALEKYDQGAAEALKFFNKNGYYIRKLNGGFKK